MADIARLRVRLLKRHDRIKVDLAKQAKDITKLFLEIEERGMIIDTLATEVEELREEEGDKQAG